MKPSYTLLALSLVSLSLPAAAGPLACPDLAVAVQVGACPSEDELRYTYTGYCSDNARLYDKATDGPCARYENYRKLKNTALWESGDGEFNGYVSCDLSAAAIKNAKPLTAAVARQGTMTRVSCSYGDDIVFSHRTRATCKPSGLGAECE